MDGHAAAVAREVESFNLSLVLDDAREHDGFDCFEFECTAIHAEAESTTLVAKRVPNLGGVAT